MRADRPIPMLPEDISSILEDLGFDRAETSVSRILFHPMFPETKPLDATAMADDKIVSQAVRWIESAAVARGKARLRERISEILT